MPRSKEWTFADYFPNFAAFEEYRLSETVHNFRKFYGKKSKTWTYRCSRGTCDFHLKAYIDNLTGQITVYTSGHHEHPLSQDSIVRDIVREGVSQNMGTREIRLLLERQGVLVPEKAKLYNMISYAKTKAKMPDLGPPDARDRFDFPGIENHPNSESPSMDNFLMELVLQKPRPQIRTPKQSRQFPHFSRSPRRCESHQKSSQPRVPKRWSRNAVALLFSWTCTERMQRGTISKTLLQQFRGGAVPRRCVITQGMGLRVKWLSE